MIKRLGIIQFKKWQEAVHIYVYGGTHVEITNGWGCFFVAK